MGAAHDRGVLHRDLKPANIMIDGQGQVRIADFGIASMAATEEANRALVGTPAYMAPELFAGGQPSIRSDLFSLGVVLYEAVTGKPPFAGKPLGLAGTEAKIIPPSAIASNVDPALERVILQCLQREPSRTPSAHVIAASLPGGDLLAEAIASGQTPSPSLVAAAHARWTLPRWAGICCLAIGLLALAVVVPLANIAFFLPRAPSISPPPCSPTKRSIFSRRSAPNPIVDGESQGFAVDRGYLDYARTAPHNGFEGLARQWPAPVSFWYSAGRRAMALPTLLNEPQPVHFLPAGPASITVRLDSHGRSWNTRQARAACVRAIPARSRSIGRRCLRWPVCGLPTSSGSATAPARPSMPTRCWHGKARTREHSSAAARGRRKPLAIASFTSKLFPPGSNGARKTTKTTSSRSSTGG